MIYISDDIREIFDLGEYTNIVNCITGDDSKFCFNMHLLFRPTQNSWYSNVEPDLTHPINLLHMVGDKIGYYSNAQIKKFLLEMGKKDYPNAENYMPVTTIKNLLAKLNEVVKPTVAKPAKVLKKILEEYNFSAQDYSFFGEVYNNVYIRKNCQLDSIIIVSGEDIRKYYHADNYYSQSGYLGDSCMRYSSCQRYLDLYVYNPNQIKLLVYLIDGKVGGRCLIWNDEYSDVIYYNYEYIKIAIDKYCKEAGYKPTCLLDKNVTFTLDRVDFQYYPYVDTFMFLNLNKRTVSTDKYSGVWSMRSLNGDKFD